MRNRLLVSLLLILSVLAVFWPASGFDFVSWDDNIHVYENRYLNPVTVDNTLHFWKESYIRLYIPVSYTFWSFLGWLSQLFPAAPYGSAKLAASGLNPHIFHTANLILHLINTLIVFSFLRLLLTYGFKDEKNERENRDPSKIDIAAGIGALVFALHPLHVESVAWVTGMKNLLSGMFSLLAIRGYLAYSIAAKGMNDNFNKPVHYIIASAAYVLAVLAKPVAVVLPLVAFILDQWAVKRPFRDSAISLSGWFLAAGLFSIVTIAVQESGTDVTSTPLWARPFIAGDALAFYLYKLIFPLQLGIDYGRSPEFVMQQWWGYATWIFPVVILVGVMFLKKREPILVSLGIFAAALLPVLGFVPFVFQIYSTVSDHYFYFPMLGASILFSWIFLNHRTKFTVSVFALAIILFGFRSAFLVPAWQNDTALYLHALKVNPDSYLSHNNMGLLLVKKGKPAEAIVHYEKAIKFQPGLANAHNNMGLALVKQGKLDEAIAHFKVAVKISPGLANAHNNMGLALVKQGNPVEAVSHFKEAMKSQPQNAEIHDNLGVALASQGKLDEAIAHFKKALTIRPDLAFAQRNLGIALKEKERLHKPVALFPNR